MTCVVSDLRRGTRVTCSASTCSACFRVLKVRMLESRFSEALIIACKYMPVHLFLASRRYCLKSCDVADGYRRQLRFFDLCQLKVLLVKVKLICFISLPCFLGFTG